MPTTPEQFEAMRQRTEAGHGAIARRKGVSAPGSALVSAVAFLEHAEAERETGRGGLHEQVVDYCRQQHPRWLVIAARTDQRSTIAVGSHDCTVFLTGGRVLCCELKAKGKKPSIEQLAWHKQMEMLGHKVNVVYSLEHFKEIIK